MPHQWHEFRGRQELSAALAAELVTGLAGLLAEAPLAGLVAAGGTTAPPVFEKLSAAPLDWKRVCVTPSDERWVPPSDDASNEKMIREMLLRGPAAAARFIPIYDAAQATPEAGEAACNARLAAMPWPASLCLLGMGRDGHAASLFPGAAALDDALDPKFRGLCKPVRPLTAEVAGPHPRMTLTLPALTRTRHIYIVITGADKRATFERALGPGAEKELPVRAILRQAATPVDVYWAA